MHLMRNAILMGTFVDKTERSFQLCSPATEMDHVQEAGFADVLRKMTSEASVLNELILLHGQRWIMMLLSTPLRLLSLPGYSTIYICHPLALPIVRAETLTPQAESHPSTRAA